MNTIEINKVRKRLADAATRLSSKPNRLLVHPTIYAWWCEYEIWDMMESCKLSFWQFLKRFTWEPKR